MEISPDREILGADLEPFQNERRNLRLARPKSLGVRVRILIEQTLGLGYLVVGAASDKIGLGDGLHLGPSLQRVEVGRFAVLAVVETRVPLTLNNRSWWGFLSISIACSS
jgi:hypothetical protein